jgi:hypothetical protein
MPIQTKAQSRLEIFVAKSTLLKLFKSNQQLALRAV